jgi:hypothetical protein
MTPERQQEIASWIDGHELFRVAEPEVPQVIHELLDEVHRLQYGMWFIRGCNVDAKASPFANVAPPHRVLNTYQDIAQRIQDGEDPRTWMLMG